MKDLFKSGGGYIIFPKDRLPPTQKKVRGFFAAFFKERKVIISFCFKIRF
jgi:hypothetical protein